MVLLCQILVHAWRMTAPSSRLTQGWCVLATVNASMESPILSRVVLAVRASCLLGGDAASMLHMPLNWRWYDNWTRCAFY